MKIFLFIVMTLFVLSSACKKENDIETEPLLLANVKIGTIYLDQLQTIENIPVDKNIIIAFNKSLDTSTTHDNVILKEAGAGIIQSTFQYSDNDHTIVLTPINKLENNTTYTLDILPGLSGSEKQIFSGITYSFRTIKGRFFIDQISVNDMDFSLLKIPQNINFKDIKIEILFSESLNTSNYQTYFSLTGNPVVTYSLSESNKKLTITNSAPLNDLSRYYFNISSNLTSANGFEFAGFTNQFYTSLDSSYKFPEITDDQLLELVQSQTFKYFWDFAHPTSGLIRDRNTSGDIVTLSGTGFGIMSIIVGIEHNFITRAQGLARLETILNFLESADRFHGAWPHWLNGATGKVQPFSTKDNGGDLVETAFLVEGLLTFRQYLNSGVPSENALIAKINTLWQSVEWNWYTQGGQNVLYWHWSPSYGWDLNHQIRGYNEALITYILARASTNYKIPTSVFHQGYCSNGNIVNGNTYYGYKLPLGEAYGGPLFYEHYSFVALDPRNLHDSYANYWEQAVNHSLINWTYCKNNPKNYVGYSADCWGLTASDNYQNYSAHSPTNDLGVISPTAAVSSIAYCPEQSMRAIKHFYYLLGDKLWGEYGFYDAFAPTENWWANSYIAIDQGPIILMIENYKTGLLWNLFMSCPEVTGALDDLGFTY